MTRAPRLLALATPSLAKVACGAEPLVTLLTLGLFKVKYPNPKVRLQG